ncbi:glutathione peroxidase [Gordonia humi]
MRLLTGIKVWDMSHSNIKSVAVNALDGSPFDLAALTGPLLIVNVASKCGLTPQYTALEQLQKTYGPKGLTVVGMPCNQFMGQEPGTAEEIATFCSTSYGVTFPLLEKADVNGADRHPLYAALTEKADADGEAGDIAWNFEKFLVSADGETIARFRPRTEPDAPEVVAAIEAAL